MWKNPFTKGCKQAVRLIYTIQSVKKQLFRNDIIMLVLWLGLVISVFVNIYWMKGMVKIAQRTDF